MNVGRTLFSQIMDFVPWTSFDRLVARYGGDVRVRKLPCTEQFRAMAFAQMTYRESLRDIEACLGAQPAKLYSMGFRKAVAKSTLADANERRDWRLWHGLAVILIGRARKLYAHSDIGLDPAFARTGLETPCTRSIAPQSIYAFRCFHGPASAPPKPLSKCTRCSI